MAKASKGEHPLSESGRLARLWQTKHGELCQALHDARTSKQLAECSSTPGQIKEYAKRELPKQYEQVGRLAIEAGPSAFRACWSKSGDMFGVLTGRSFQAMVLDAVESAWPAMSQLFIEFRNGGKIAVHPKVPDYHKAGLRERARQSLERDPRIKRMLAQPHGGEIFEKAFRRAIKELRLDRLPSAKPGPRKAPKKKTRR